MKLNLIILALFLSTIINSQNDEVIKSFDAKKNNLNRKDMVVLTSWAGVNIVGSFVGYVFTNSYEEKQFYIMNGCWGAINLGLSLPALLSKDKPTGTWHDVYKKQTNMEKIFLANTMLDVAYMLGGAYYMNYASQQTNELQKQRGLGFGKSIIIQGAGLFLFDLTMTVLNNRNRKKHLDPFLKNATISFTGNSVGLGYRFN